MIKKLFSNKYFVAVLVITLVLIATVIYNSNKSYETKATDSVILKITSPIQKAFFSVSSGVRNFFTHFEDVAELHDQNKELNDKIARLEENIERNNAYKIENERLRNLLNLKDTYKNFELTAANVIGRDSSRWFISLTLDKGSKDGISMTDTVITNDGLVGHITDIGTDWSRVTSILDSQSTVSVVVERTEDIAMVDGDIDLSENGLCKMTYIPKDSTLTIGDNIKTSGLGGVYPKGLDVGKIKEIHSDNQGVSQYAIVSPAVNFDKIYEVLIITN